MAEKQENATEIRVCATVLFFRLFFLYFLGEAKTYSVPVSGRKPKTYFVTAPGQRGRNATQLSHMQGPGGEGTEPELENGTVRTRTK